MIKIKTREKNTETWKHLYYTSDPAKFILFDELDEKDSADILKVANKLFTYISRLEKKTKQRWFCLEIYQIERRNTKGVEDKKDGEVYSVIFGDMRAVLMSEEGKMRRMVYREAYYGKENKYHWIYIGRDKWLLG